ncbi:MAG: hypothetical protein ABIA63_14505, partial [bacterium]
QSKTLLELYQHAALCYRLYQEKHISSRNLYDAFKQMELLLLWSGDREVDADSLKKWRGLKGEYEIELVRKFEDLKSYAKIAERQEKWGLCKSHLSKIMACFPDEKDKRYQWARENYRRL